MVNCPPTSIPTGLWERLPGYGTLYLLARILDPLGSGRAEINVAKAARDLDLAPRTVQDYVRRCRQHGLFRAICWHGTDHVRMVYTSLAKVACAWPGGSGVMVSVAPNQLKLKKAIIAEAEAVGLQRQSYWSQKQEQKGKQHRNQPHMPALAPIFGPTSSDNAGGTSSILYRGQRCLFVDGQFPVFGATQATLAGRLGCHPNTMQRRLSNRYRHSLAERRGADLDTLERLQLAIRTAIPPGTLQHARAESWGGDEGIAYFEQHGRVWQASCCIYNSELVVRSPRRLNNRIARLQAQGLASTGVTRSLPVSPPPSTDPDDAPQGTGEHLMATTFT